MKHKRYLITGCNGFIGSHMARRLLSEKEVEVIALVNGDTQSLSFAEERLEIIEFDILNQDRLDRILAEHRVEHVLHLAAQSSIPEGWHRPKNTLEINAIGTFNLLHCLYRLRFAGRILVVGAGAEYGYMDPGEDPIGEDKVFRPTSIYGVSKIASDMLGYFFGRSLGLGVVRVRPFNVSGPGKVGDACSDFARGIAGVERGSARELRVGNLNAVRDYIDVRDAVEGMLTALHNGEVGECYNLCSGQGHRIGEILEILLKLSNFNITVIKDKNKLRPVDEPIDIGANYRLRSLGWKPKIPLEKTLEDTLNFWRMSPDP